MELRPPEPRPRPSRLDSGPARTLGPLDSNPLDPGPLDFDPARPRPAYPRQAEHRQHEDRKAGEEHVLVLGVHVFADRGGDRAPYPVLRGRRQQRGRPGGVGLDFLVRAGGGGVEARDLQVGACLVDDDRTQDRDADAGHGEQVARDQRSTRSIAPFACGVRCSQAAAPPVPEHEQHRGRRADSCTAGRA